MRRTTTTPGGCVAGCDWTGGIAGRCAPSMELGTTRAHRRGIYPLVKVGSTNTWVLLGLPPSGIDSAAAIERGPRRRNWRISVAADCAVLGHRGARHAYQIHSCAVRRRRTGGRAQRRHATRVVTWRPRPCASPPPSGCGTGWRKPPWTTWRTRPWPAAGICTTTGSGSAPKAATNGVWGAERTASRSSAAAATWGSVASRDGGARGRRSPPKVAVPPDHRQHEPRWRRGQETRPRRSAGRVASRDAGKHVLCEKPFAVTAADGGPWRPTCRRRV